VRLAGLILFCVFVSALLTGWVLKRFGNRWGAWFSFVGGMLGRLVASLVFAWTAVRAADWGGVWFGALEVALSFLALAGFALFGFLTWGLLKYGIDADE
jgi:hypothetical protein